MNKTLTIYPEEYFRRQDENDDLEFYQMPRKVMHIDDAAALALSQFYADVLPKTGRYLDLMASWRSHLPIPLVRPEKVVGLGLNAPEMLDNPQISEDAVWVHNLNAEPVLPFADGEFSAVVCALSVQYLIRPLEVFTEVNRVLQPGGIFAVSFSNRCFPSKATAVWLSTTDAQHVELVASYFVNSGGWGEVQVRIKSSELGGKEGEDPLFMIWAGKN